MTERPAGDEPTTDDLDISAEDADAIKGASYQFNVNETTVDDEADDDDIVDADASS